MKSKWLHRQAAPELIIFFAGWGMDEHPFRHMVSSDYDVLLGYDYKELPSFDTVGVQWESYEKIHVIGWSMGVWMAQHVFAGIPGVVDSATAINGTLCPIHDMWGIPEKIFHDTLFHFDENTRYKFYRRMCREKTNLKLFLSRQPRRALEDQREELQVLAEKVRCLPPEHSIFTVIVVADCDWIVPSVNQFRFWNRQRVHTMSGFHYLFNIWQSWDHLLLYCRDADVDDKEKDNR